MNVRRGFNRAFVVAWVVWVLFLVWWAMDFAAKDRASLDDLIYQGEHGRSWDSNYRASQAELANWRKQREESTFWAITRGFITTRDGLSLLATLFVVFPAIVYTVLFTTGWTAGWVYRGFRGDGTRLPTDIG